MKKTVILTFCSLIAFAAISQNYRADVKTPKGSNVAAWITEESSIQTRTYWDASVAGSYPNAQQIKTYDDFSSSRRFNCHGYAWHMSELSNPLSEPRWIGYYADNTDEHIYWQDGSYVEVSQEVYPGKVSWASGDHSAVTTSEKGWFISKWNEYPLLKHRWDDSPYGTTNLKYYKKAPPPYSISGPTTVCDQATYTIETLPAGATVQWSASNNNLTLVSQQDNSAVFRKNGNGSCEVRASITLNEISFSLPSQRIWTGAPNSHDITLTIESLNSNGILCTDNPNAMIANHVSGVRFGFVLEYQWNISYGWQIGEHPGNGSLMYPENFIITVIPLDFASLNPTASVRARSKCGWGEWKVVQIPSSSCLRGSGFFSLSPNPAGSFVTLQLDKASDNAKTASRAMTNFADSGVYEIQLWNATGLIKTVKANEPTVQIPLDGLPKGFYYVHVIKNGKTYRRQLVIDS